MVGTKFEPVSWDQLPGLLHAATPAAPVQVNVAGAILISSCSHSGFSSTLRRARRREYLDLEDDGEEKKPEKARRVLMGCAPEVGLLGKTAWAGYDSACAHDLCTV